jgi:hypothetical protein
LAGNFQVEVRVALSGDGARHLLIQSDLLSNTAGSGGSLNHSVRKLAFGNVVKRYLDISCSDPDLLGVFDDLIVDLLRQQSDSAELAEGVLESLERWRLLFSRTAGLSREQRIGLFAELSVLKIALTHSPPATLSAWTGPLGKAHDFEFQRSCIEVKAIGSGSPRVRVHGLGQLDTHDGRALDLLILKVSETLAGTTINELAEQIVELAGPSTILDSLLEKAGAKGELHSELFELETTYHVVIRPGVPRLTHSQIQGGVPKGVSRVEYDLSLDVLLEFVSSSSVTEVIANALGSNP